MEKLVALCYLWAFGLDDKDDYYAELNRLFLENPEDDLLLELEMLNPEDSGAWWKAWSSLKKRITDSSLFERELFKALGDFYDKYCIFEEESKEIWERFGTDFKSRDAYFEETGKITLFTFCERCFELGDSLDIDRKLKNVLTMPHYSFEHMDRYAGELPQTDEEIIEEIRQKFRETFDFYKEKP